MMHDPINKIIMEEIGLTVDNRNMVTDQDTRESLQFKEKNLKYSSQNSITVTNGDIIFDPATNKNMMTSLFNHFTKKLEEEDGTYISLFSEKEERDSKTSLEAKVDGGVLTTKAYKNASLKYVDMIQQLNGSKNVDLTEYDSDPYSSVDKKAKKRKSLFC